MRDTLIELWHREGLDARSYFDDLEHAEHGGLEHVKAVGPVF